MSQSYDATTHFESTVQDVIASLERYIFSIFFFVINLAFTCLQDLDLSVDLSAAAAEDA